MPPERIKLQAEVSGAPAIQAATCFTSSGVKAIGAGNAAMEVLSVFAFVVIKVLLRIWLLHPCRPIRCDAADARSKWRPSACYMIPAPPAPARTVGFTGMPPEMIQIGTPYEGARLRDKPAATSLASSGFKAIGAGSASAAMPSFVDFFIMVTLLRGS
jgi:hypothetical protein